jgi:YkoP-like protein
MAGPRIESPGGRARRPYRWAVMVYDRAYRLVHGLDRPPAQVGPALCVEVRRSRLARRLPDGTRLALGDRIGVIHLNNARLAAVRVNGQSPLAIGLEFRRWFLASLRELAQLAADRGALADVRAFCAITIFYRGLSRFGFRPERRGIVWPGLTAAYQRALMASLHPVGPLHFRRATHAQARRVWLTREELLSRYT